MDLQGSIFLALLVALIAIGQLVHGFGQPGV